MAWSLIASASAQNTTSGVDTTGADLIILSVGQSTSGSTTPSDSKSNTWTALTKSNGVSDGATRIYYCYNPTVGTGHTFSAGLSYTVVSFHAFSGSASSPFDVENGNGTASGSTMPTGSITPSVDGELIIAALGMGNTTTGTTIDSSFTGTVVTEATGYVTYGGGQAYFIQSTAGAINPAWSSATGFSSAYAAAIASFKVSAGSGVSGTAAVTLGSATSSATGTTTVKGSAAPTLGNATSSATGVVGSVSGTAAITLGNDTSSAQGTTSIGGTGAVTLGNDICSASGAVGSAITGTAAITLGNDASSAQGTTKILGSAAIILGTDFSTTQGTTKILGSAAITLGDDFATAFGTSGTPTTVSSPRGLTIRIGLAL